MGLAKGAYILVGAYIPAKSGCWLENGKSVMTFGSLPPRACCCDGWLLHPRLFYRHSRDILSTFLDWHGWCMGVEGRDVALKRKEESFSSLRNKSIDSSDFAFSGKKESMRPLLSRA